MTTALDALINHRGFFLEEKPFIPNITKDLEGNTLWITLPAGPNDSLNWSKEALLAKEAISQGKLLFWQIDLGMKNIQLDDTPSFLSRTIAIEEFAKTLWVEFQHKTLGVSLYSGDLDLPFDEKLRPQFQEWKLDLKEEIFDEKVFYIDLFSQYLHRLASFLPASANPFCLFNTCGSDAHIALTLSKERFTHLYLGIKGSSLKLGSLYWEDGWKGRDNKASIGICFPMQEYCTKEVLSQLDHLFQALPEYRLVFEPFLTEEWDELEHLFVISSAVSPMGMRKLHGFCAAGGEVIVIGEEMGLASEISWKDFEKRKSE